ncbi:MAG TPA: hypothetical protein VLF93_00785 [Candidatus Saccharimonadales bacterium]|nr:hypothetical protein [Candidatus Saccharimonadales bacterium]
MAEIVRSRINLGTRNEEIIANAHTDSLIKEYGDRRGALGSAKLQKTAGYLGLTLGVTALFAAAVLAPYVVAPTALGILGASGAATAEVGGGTMVVGWFRDIHNRRQLRRIPGRG